MSLLWTNIHAGKRFDVGSAEVTKTGVRYMLHLVSTWWESGNDWVLPQSAKGMLPAQVHRVRPKLRNRLKHEKVEQKNQKSAHAHLQKLFQKW
jgi:hypothetical protein